jgi:hypothetical protein
MPNYNPKGRVRMSERGHLGAARSAETRRRIAVVMRKIDLTGLWDATGGDFTKEQLIQAIRYQVPRPDLRGGGHDTDWRCDRCHHFNSIGRWECGACGSSTPANGRLTRAALRERAAEHRIAAIMRNSRL